MYSIISLLHKPVLNLTVAKCMLYEWIFACKQISLVYQFLKSESNFRSENILGMEMSTY